MVSQSPFAALPATLAWQENGLYLLDQTRLPQEIVVERISEVEEVWRWIHELRVRGAPAIGVAAAYGLCVATQPLRHLSMQDFQAQLTRQASFLDSARPTAVNLSWSLKRMLRAAQSSGAQDSAALYDVLVAEATKIHTEDQALCAGIGTHEALRQIMRRLGLPIDDTIVVVTSSYICRDRTGRLILELPTPRMMSAWAIATRCCIPPES